MISVAICDDNRTFCKQMNDRLAAMAEKRRIGCSFELFYDGEDLLDSVLKGVRFDIIFLDIEMTSCDGIKTAEGIREVDKTALIIYVSSHSQYAIEAYKVRPFQFLPKPFKVSQLEKYFASAIDEVLIDDAYFRYVDRNKNFKLPLKEILYFESKLRNVEIVLNDEVRSYREKLEHVDKALSGPKLGFWRIHQSLLVNQRHIYQIKYSEVKMSNGTILPIAQSRRGYIRQHYLSKMENSTVE